MFNHSYVTGGLQTGVQVQRKVNLVWDNLKVHSEVRLAASCRRVRLTGDSTLFFHHGLLPFNVNKGKCYFNELVCMFVLTLILAWPTVNSQYPMAELSPHSPPFGNWKHVEATQTKHLVEGGLRCPQRSTRSPARRPLAKTSDWRFCCDVFKGLNMWCFLTAISQHAFIELLFCPTTQC